MIKSWFSNKKSLFSPNRPPNSEAEINNNLIISKIMRKCFLVMDLWIGRIVERKKKASSTDEKALYSPGIIVQITRF